MVALLPCLDHAQTALNLCRFLCVEHAYTEARGQRPNFRAHFNLWWARHGWLLIHLAARPDGQFSRPPYFTAGVNLTAEIPSEPPRGGEHGAGENCLNKKTFIRGIPKLSKIIASVSHKPTKTRNAADS